MRATPCRGRSESWKPALVWCHHGDDRAGLVQHLDHFVELAPFARRIARHGGERAPGIIDGGCVITKFNIRDLAVRAVGELHDEVIKRHRVVLPTPRTPTPSWGCITPLAPP